MSENEYKEHVNINFNSLSGIEQYKFLFFMKKTFKYAFHFQKLHNFCHHRQL